MFKKKECKKCKKKIHSQYEFCPYCGDSLNENFKEDWGMLGRSDEMNENRRPVNPMFGGDMFGRMLGNAMRMLQKEMQKQMKNNDLKSRTNFRLMINGKEVNLNNRPQQKRPRIVKKKIKFIKFPSSLSEENLKKFSKLPREEPITNVRRFSDKLIYEIELKGVESVEDIAIIRLENSIEIKAVAEDRSYFKLIPINLPIINYHLAEGKLVLEFGVK